jgi:hypothetical protein
VYLFNELNIDRMKKDPYFLSREALYIKVWETPAVKLTKGFGVLDVAITKMCRRLEIPKPPKGYWRRIETGYKKTIPNLAKKLKFPLQTACFDPSNEGSFLRQSYEPVWRTERRT